MLARKYAVTGNGPVSFRVWSRKGKGKRKTKMYMARKTFKVVQE